MTKQELKQLLTVVLATAFTHFKQSIINPGNDSIITEDEIKAAYITDFSIQAHTDSTVISIMEVIKLDKIMGGSNADEIQKPQL